MSRLVSVLVMIFCVNAYALTAEDRLQNPAQEQEAHDIFKQLRCVVCSGESINDSKADLAKELRILVRNHLKDGKSSAEIISYVTSRYGDEVLMRTPIRPETYVLWGLPAFMVLLGGLGIAMFYRKSK